MSRKQYLLIEWVEEGNVFPSYDIVNSKSVISDETDFNPGKIIFVRTNGNSAKQAQILKVSDDKKQINEHKVMLERQDHQVKNMLSMCMRTIKELKTDPLLYANKSTSSAGVSNATVVQAQHDYDDGSDSSEDEKATKKCLTHKPLNGSSKTSTSTVKKTRRSVLSSTPLPANSTKDVPKLMFDQATQTDNVTQVPTEKIEQMEVVLNHLYRQFLTLVSRLQLDCFEPGNVEKQNEVSVNFEEMNGVENNAQEPPEKHFENVNVEVQDLRKNAKLEVRRVSAQTTNTVEHTLADRNMMVPIGLGHAQVPARLLNEIDWNSYTTATRRLLQAVFPRKVLATHSLSGKPSPAFSGKPVKKCLDPKLTEDIVRTVVEHCGVARGIVRKNISIMCADEAKLYRLRMRGRNHQSIKQENQENEVPLLNRSREPSNESHV